MEDRLREIARWRAVAEAKGQAQLDALRRSVAETHEQAKLVAGLFWGVVAGGYLLISWQAVSLTAGLLALQAWIVAAGLLHRRVAKTTAPWFDQWIAWLSALLPLVLHLPVETLAGKLVNLTGLGVTVWALLTLADGRAFAIAPADRGLIAIGPYRFLRHPMYTGELLSVLGVVFFGNFTLWNLLIILLLMLTLLRRIHVEEGLVSGYRSYAYTVRWRILPGVW